MGRANPILNIVVADVFLLHPKISELREKGHRIIAYSRANTCTEGAVPDLLLHPAAHNWNDTDWDYLEAALATARARRKKK